MPHMHVQNYIFVDAYSWTNKQIMKDMEGSTNLKKMLPTNKRKMYNYHCMENFLKHSFPSRDESLILSLIGFLIQY